MHLSITTETADDTRAAGAEIAGLLRPRDVVVLTGDLGAGKTTLTQGIARGLGAGEHVTSPTFTLVREYPSGRIPIAHVDVYRLRRAQDVLDLALDEVEASRDGVLIVEWGDPVADLLGTDRLRIELTTPDPASETRAIALGVSGDAWTDRWAALAGVLAAWAAA